MVVKKQAEVVKKWVMLVANSEKQVVVMSPIYRTRSYIPWKVGVLLPVP